MSTAEMRAGGMAGTVSVGAVKVTGLLDMLVDFPMPLDQLFPEVSDDQWVDFRERYPEVFTRSGGWRYHVHCYLLHAGGTTILVDTGCGRAGLPFPAFLGQRGELHALLRGEGIRPDDIDVVVITHVHPDHCGGLVASDDEVVRAAFPRARHLVHRADWETWSRPEVKEGFPIAFVDETVGVLASGGRLELVEDGAVVIPSVQLLHTPGHTPGSMSVLISSEGERALLCGDAWLHPAQVTEPGWASAFDMAPDQATRSRIQLADRIEAEGLTIGVCHFPAPFGQLVRLGERRHWIAL